MWISTKDLVKENLAEIGQIKDKLAELEQVKTQLKQIKSDVNSLRIIVGEKEKSLKDMLLVVKKDLTKCVNLLSSDDLSKRVDNLKNGQDKMAVVMREVLRNVSLLDDTNRLILANLLLKDIDV